MVRGLAPKSDERIEVVQICTSAENHSLLSNYLCHHGLQASRALDRFHLVQRCGQADQAV
jgi:hypothetical protein